MTEINLKYGEYVQLDNMTGKYLIHRLDGSTEDIGSDGRMRLVYEAITEEKTMTKEEAIKKAGEEIGKRVQEYVGCGWISTSIRSEDGYIRWVCGYENGNVPYTVPRPIPPKGTPVMWDGSIGFLCGDYEDGKGLRVADGPDMEYDYVWWFEN